ncbi:MAG: nucleotidyltransferase family protein [Thermoplasmatota archaeon]
MTKSERMHNIHIPQKQIKRYCQRYHIKKLALFGSFLRDDFGSDSDIDILVEFEKGHTPGFFDLHRMQEQLSTLFNGRKIDLRTPADLSRYFREKVVSNAEVLYAGS